MSPLRRKPLYREKVAGAWLTDSGRLAGGLEAQGAGVRKSLALIGDADEVTHSAP